MSPALGHARLLLGMVRANRPWRARALVAAFATGAYVLLVATIWQLSAALGWPQEIARSRGGLSSTRNNGRLSWRFEPAAPSASPHRRPAARAPRSAVSSRARHLRSPLPIRA